MKMMLGGIGGMSRRSGTLTSYLLFEKPYTLLSGDLKECMQAQMEKRVPRFVD